MEKVKKIIIWVIVVIAIATYLSIIVPGTKRHFLCFEMFRLTADYDTYIKPWPKSAKAVKYYVYEKPYLDKSGYRAIFSKEDYEAAKQNRIAAYSSEYVWGTYYYEGGNKRILDMEEMERLQIDFLDELLPENADYSQYYILADSLGYESQKNVYGGVLCNDNTCEMIEFTYYWYFGESQRMQQEH